MLFIVLLLHSVPVGFLLIALVLVRRSADVAGVLIADHG
jgi:hypothetical protein